MDKSPSVGGPATPRARRVYELLLLGAAMWSAIYARTTLGPLQEAIRVSLALSDNQIAVLQGPALSVPFVVAAIPLGLAINRFSRVRLIFLFALFNLIGSAGSALAPNFGTLLVLRGLIGVTSTGTWPIACSVLADLFAATERGRASMLLLIGGAGGMSSAFAVGGALLPVSGSGLDAWRWAMLGLSAPLVPITLLLLLMREPSRTDTRSEPPSTSEVFIQLWNLRAVLCPLVAAMVAVAGIADGATTVWAASVFSRRFALPPDRIGAIMAMILLVNSLFGPILGGTLTDVCQRSDGARRTMTVLIGCSMVSVPTALFAVAPGVSSMSILFALFTASASAVSVVVVLLTLSIVPNALRGICISLMSAAGLFAAFAIGPLMVSMISGAIGGPAMIGTALSVLCVGSCILGVLLLVRGRRYFRGSGACKVGALVGRRL